MHFARTIRGLLLASFPVVVAMAQSDDSPVRVDLAYASRSVFRGVARAGDSLQADVEISRDNLRGGLRTSQPFGGSGAREMNLHGGWLWHATDNLTLEPTLAHAWFGDVPGGGVKRSLEAGLAATLSPVQGFTPAVRYYHDFRFRADTVGIAFARSVALTKLGAFLEWNFFGGSVTGGNWRPDAGSPRRRDSYCYWGGEVSLPYRIGAHSTVVAGLHYSEASGWSSTNGPFGRSPHPGAWVTIGVNLDF
jgi:hypothetical protein